MERLPAREFAARAALDAALHDLQGKLLGQPVWRLLGLRRAGPPTSWTIWLGDPDDMARRAEKALDRFRRLKLKLGGRDGLDVERVRAVRGVAGDLPLQVDVNEAWSLDEALESLPAARRARRRVLRAAAARRRRRRARAEGALADSDLRRRGLPHARRRRRVRGARARDQRQAREVGRDPRGGADGARRPRARARLHARLHGRVGARHLRRRAGRVPLRPRRPRRQPPARARPVAGRPVRRRRAASTRGARARCPCA